MSFFNTYNKYINNPFSILFFIYSLLLSFSSCNSKPEPKDSVSTKATKIEKNYLSDEDIQNNKVKL